MAERRQAGRPDIAGGDSAPGAHAGRQRRSRHHSRRSAWSSTRPFRGTARHGSRPTECEALWHGVGRDPPNAPPAWLHRVGLDPPIRCVGNRRGRSGMRGRVDPKANGGSQVMVGQDPPYGLRGFLRCRLTHRSPQSHRVGLDPPEPQSSHRVGLDPPESRKPDPDFGFLAPWSTLLSNAGAKPALRCGPCRAACSPCC